MNKDIHPKLKLIINQAIKESQSFDDLKVRPEHLILSILNDNDNASTKIIKSLKVDINGLHDNISDFLRKSDLIPRITLTNKRKPPFSEETKAIFKLVDKECEKYSDKMIETQHIMLTILSSKLPINDILNDVGINYNSFKNKMKEEIKSSGFDDSDMDDTNEGFRKKPIKSDAKSKTPVLDNFCRDVSKAVENGEIDPVIGRQQEIKRVSQILSRRKKNNPILIGEPGVGKTSIVEGLAQIIQNGTAPRTLIGKRIFTLDLASIVAGTKFRGQFEERMKAILQECKANPDVVLFIDELHTIIGAGNASGSLDASNIFKPALARGELQVIGATTLDEYRENIEKDGALTRRFQQVLVEEPNLDETKTILLNIKDKYEKHHKVKYTDEAIDECVKLSARYIMDRSMPDKAIDVLDEAGASTNVTVEKPESIKLLEAKRLEIIENKKEVVLKQKYEEAAKLRDEEKKVDEGLEKALADWNESLDQNITEIGVEKISEIVSMMTGIPLNKISTQEGKKLLNLDKELSGSVIGQESAVIKVVKAIKRNRIGIKDKNKPVGSFIFLGPTGVGKCICGDSEITVRNKLTGEIKIINVKNIVPDTN